MQKIFSHKQLVLVSTALVLALCFFGCYTAKKATKQVTKAQSKQPIVVAKKCQEYYPITEKITIDTVIDSKDYDSVKQALGLQLHETEIYVNELQKQIGQILSNPNCEEKNKAIIALNNELSKSQNIVEKLQSLPPIIKEIEKEIEKEDSAKLFLAGIAHETTKAELRDADKEIAELVGKLQAEHEDKIKQEKLKQKWQFKFWVLLFLIAAYVGFKIYRKTQAIRNFLIFFPY